MRTLERVKLAYGVVAMVTFAFILPGCGGGGGLDTLVTGPTDQGDSCTALKPACYVTSSPVSSASSRLASGTPVTLSAVCSGTVTSSQWMANGVTLGRNVDRYTATVSAPSGGSAEENFGFIATNCAGDSMAYTTIYVADGAAVGGGGSGGSGSGGGNNTVDYRVIDCAVTTGGTRPTVTNVCNFPINIDYCVEGATGIYASVNCSNPTPSYRGQLDYGKNPTQIAPGELIYVATPKDREYRYYLGACKVPALVIMTSLTDFDCFI